jgi:hypothetical protein
MKKFMMLFLTMTGCALTHVEANLLYHSSSLRPELTEITMRPLIPDDVRFMTVQNPFPRRLTLNLDCDSEMKLKTISVPANGKSSFLVFKGEYDSSSCSIEPNWSVE